MKLWLGILKGTFFCVSLPFLFLLPQALVSANANWEHIRTWVLNKTLIDTVLLTGGSVTGALLIGVPLAWVTTVYRFPGSRVFGWLLVLPMALPSYVVGYVYYHLASYTGFFQTWFRAQGWDGFSRLFDLPPLLFAVWVFALTLYPYVYLVVRAFLKRQSTSLFENARLLAGERRVFWGVFLPLIFPAASAGGTLAALEVLGDFGVASHFGLNTFTTAIFGAWFGMSDMASAAKLSLIVLLGVLSLSLLNRWTQQNPKYRVVSSRERPLSARPVSAFRGLLLCGLCTLVLLFAAVVPLLHLVYWLKLSFSPEALVGLWDKTATTLLVGLYGTVLAVFAATGTVYAARLAPTKINLLLSHGVTAGYYVPGAVLAMGVLSFFGFFSVSGLGMLIFAYGVRFLAVAHHSVESGFAKIGGVYGEAARILGSGPSRVFFRIKLPLLRHALFGGAVATFIDILKELPLTLSLRPFNFNTLGTGIYDYAHNEMLADIALPSLTLVFLSAALLLCTAALEKDPGTKRSRLSPTDEVR